MITLSDLLCPEKDSLDDLEVKGFENVFWVIFLYQTFDFSRAKNMYS